MSVDMRWVPVLAAGAWLALGTGGLQADQIGGPAQAAQAGPESDPGGGTPKTLTGVPAYIWYSGCGPTACGMIIGFWDANGYGGLIPGSNDWVNNQQAIKDMIASPQHVSDYALYNGVDDMYTAIYNDMSTLDPSHAHANNSVADFMKSSFSSVSNHYGWSWFSDQDDALTGYAVYKGYAASSAYQKTYSQNLWQETVSFIDAGKPVEFLVDSDGNGSTDHFVTVIGYDDTPGARKYAALNTWNSGTHLYDYGPLTNGTAWGVYGGTFFTPAPEPGTLAVLWAAGVLLLRRRGPRKGSGQA